MSKKNNKDKAAGKTRATKSVPETDTQTTAVTLEGSGVEIVRAEGLTSTDEQAISEFHSEGAPVVTVDDTGEFNQEVPAEDAVYDPAGSDEVLTAEVIDTDTDAEVNLQVSETTGIEDVPAESSAPEETAPAIEGEPVVTSENDEFLRQLSAETGRQYEVIKGEIVVREDGSSEREVQVLAEVKPESTETTETVAEAQPDAPKFADNEITPSEVQAEQEAARTVIAVSYDAFRVAADQFINAAIAVVRHDETDSEDVKRLQETLQAFDDAYNSYIVAQPQKTRGSSPKKSSSPKAPSVGRTVNPNLGRAVTKFGVAATALFRYLGKAGWEDQTIFDVLSKAGLSPNITTIKIQAKAGRSGDTSRGPVPELSAEAVAELKALRDGDAPTETKAA